MKKMAKLQKTSESNSIICESNSIICEVMQLYTMKIFKGKPRTRAKQEET